MQKNKIFANYYPLPQYLSITVLEHIIKCIEDQDIFRRSGIGSYVGTEESSRISQRCWIRKCSRHPYSVFSWQCFIFVQKIVIRKAIRKLCMLGVFRYEHDQSPNYKIYFNTITWLLLQVLFNLLNIFIHQILTLSINTLQRCT